jgi:hypothetical protein
MQSLLRRLQASNDEHASMLNTTREAVHAMAPFQGQNFINKGRVYPKCTWGVILSGLHCTACIYLLYRWNET